ncbi:MAG: hypothetical protein MUE95_01570 [Cyclobacteriaceae bacterium]|nr:hypothetical protein [Cyclobacteriaceae bacterium]
MKFCRSAIAFICFCFTLPVFAQEEPDRPFVIDTPVSLDFEKEEEPMNTRKKKKPKKKVFYGIKTKKGFSRKGTGDRTVYENFYYLKKPEVPNTLVRDIYYYDYARREVVRTSRFDPKKGVLVHGPYKKTQNKEKKKATTTCSMSRVNWPLPVNTNGTEGWATGMNTTPPAGERN